MWELYMSFSVFACKTVLKNEVSVKINKSFYTKSLSYGAQRVCILPGLSQHQKQNLSVQAN